MSQLSSKKITEAVLNARRDQVSNREILDLLIQLGVEPYDAPPILESVDNGFKAGVVSKVARGLSNSSVPLESNQIFKIAFNRGQAEIRSAAPGWIQARAFVVGLLVANILGIVLFLAITFSS